MSRVEMRHKEYDGRANVLPENVETWKAAGWTECPARGLASAKKRASDNAKQKGQDE